jgi:DNA polymerase elongation subunit (family B)
MKEKTPKVVFDIETLAYPLSSFDEERQSYLLKYASTEAEKTEAILRMNLSPLTARILAIAMVNPETGLGRVFYEDPLGEASASTDGSASLIPCSEEEMLGRFWATIPHYPRVITFNGRGFDGPFLMVRSAMLGIPVTRNLVPYRYSANEHCDLLDQFTFYGLTRKFSLDFFCKSFMIPSPKAEGITGLDLGRLVEEGRYRDIAEYCLRDVQATVELYRYWERAFEPGDGQSGCSNGPAANR